jgi:hypothetical protein|tara:strand:+ start:40 stop:432 length:393 start_codon:yes stop_codon:yes gene_type:complete
MSDSGKRLKREEDIRNKFRELKNKTGTSKTPTFKDPRDKGTRSRMADVASLGMAGRAVRDLLDELADETAASKKIVVGLDQITGSIPGAGRAASKIAEGTTNLLKSKKQKRGGMNTDGVVDLSTEMVIDE